MLNFYKSFKFQARPFTTANKQTIKERISADLKNAMKNKLPTLQLLKLISSEIRNAEIAAVGKNENPEMTSVKLIQKMIGKSKDSIAEYEKILALSQQSSNGSSNERITEILKQERRDVELLNSYLPQQYSETELLEILENIKRKGNLTTPSALIKAAVQQVDLSRTSTKSIAEISKKIFA